MALPKLFQFFNHLMFIGSDVSCIIIFPEFIFRIIFKCSFYYIIVVPFFFQAKTIVFL